MNMNSANEIAVVTQTRGWPPVTPEGAWGLTGRGGDLRTQAPPKAGYHFLGSTSTRSRFEFWATSQKNHESIIGGDPPHLKQGPMADNFPLVPRALLFS
jgi:hypothetical protein